MKNMNKFSYKGLSKEQIEELNGFFPVEDYLKVEEDKELQEVITFFRSAKGKKIIAKLRKSPTITYKQFLKTL